VRRDLTLGIAFVAAILWLTFFASAGSVQVATLIAAVAMGIWFATVPPLRLVDHHRRPHPLVFGLTLLGALLVIVAAAVLSTATVFLVGLITLTGAGVGLVRAVRFGMGMNGDIP